MGDSRFYVLPQPLQAPGQCFISGRAGVEAGPFVDTSIFIRGTGELYISAAILKEMYRELCKYEGTDPEATISDGEKAEQFRQGFEAGTRQGHSDIKKEVKVFFNELATAFAGGADYSGAVDSLVSLTADVPDDASGAGEGESGADTSVGATSSSSRSKGPRGVSGSNGDDVTDLSL